MHSDYQVCVENLHRLHRINKTEKMATLSGTLRGLFRRSGDVTSAPPNTPMASGPSCLRGGPPQAAAPDEQTEEEVDDGGLLHALLGPEGHHLGHADRLVFGGGGQEGGAEDGGQVVDGHLVVFLALRHPATTHTRT